MEFEVRTISSEWIQCSACGWIGKSKSTLIPGYGGLLSCPACTNLSVEEYHGPTSVEVPVDLLSDVLAKLGVASFMIGNERFMGEYAEMERNCVQTVRNRLMVYMAEKGVLSEDEQEDLEGDRT